MTPPSGNWPSTDANGINLIDPISVTHQGIVVLLARQAGVATDYLYYNVMIQSAEDSSDAGLWQGWQYLQMLEPSQADSAERDTSADEQPLLRIGGIGLITVPPAARQATPVDAPFRAVSDGKYLSVFRLSANATLYVDRFLLVEQPPPPTHKDKEAGKSTRTLKRAWEARYRRSEQRDVPAGSKDSLDSRNLLGAPFLEPTTELAVIPGLVAGGFDVVRAPTADPERDRWHVFSTNSGQVQAVSFGEDDTGRLLIDQPQATTIQPLVLLSDGSNQPLALTAGVAATVYAEREQSAGPGSPNLARTVRIMVSVPVSCASAHLAAGFAVYDFLVQPDGTLPAWPAKTPVVAADGVLSPTGFTPTTGTERYVVPAEAIHVVGQGNVAGVLLGQPQPVTPPCLYDSSAGIVHLYFGGAAPHGSLSPFEVAQFDPTVTRAQAGITWNAGSQTGTVALVAQRTGVTLNGMAVTVSDTAGQPDLCQVAVDYGAASGVGAETWHGVPRELRAFVAVLNGAAALSPADPQVVANGKVYYDYGGSKQQLRLPLGAVAAPTGVVTLVANRPDLALASATVVTPPNAGATLTLTFAYKNGSMTQTWTGLPLDGGQAAQVLGGGASPAVFKYQPGAADAVLYGLATGSGTILLVRLAGQPSLTITVATADSLDALACNIVVQPSTGSSTTLRNLQRTQAAIVAALTGANLFAYVSPDPVAPAPGDVPNQVVNTALDLRVATALFGVVPPDGSGPLVAATVTAGLLQGHSGPQGPGGKTPNSLVAAAAATLNRPQFGQRATVANGSYKVSAPGQNGAWLVAATPQALASSAGKGVKIDLTAVTAQRLAPERRWTVEAWCKPDNGAESRILSYNNGAATELAGVVPSYFLGTSGLDSVEYGSYVPQEAYSSTYVNVPADPQFNPSFPGVTAFTWEAWINPNSPPCPAGKLGCVVQGQDSASSLPVFELGIDSQFHLNFGWRGVSGGAPMPGSCKSNGPLTPDAWAHVAVTGQQTGGNWTFQLYINGVADFQQPATAIFASPGSPFVCLGASDIDDVSLFGNIAEVRFWKTARSEAELERTMDTALTGYEPGLYGYWPLTDPPKDGAVYKNGDLFKNEAVVTGMGLNGIMQVKDQQATASSDGTFVSIVAGIGGAAPLEGNSFLRSTHWNHVAAVYEAAGALRLNPPGTATARTDYGVCSTAGVVTFGTANSLEAWVQVPTTQAWAQTALAQWGAEGNDQAFQLAIGSDGMPFFTINVVARTMGIGSGDGTGEQVTPITVRGTADICDGAPHHLAVTWATSGPQTSDNQQVTTCTATLYVDGVAAPVASTPIQAYGVKPRSSNAPLTLGISALPTAKTGVVALESQARLEGVLTGVRFWSATLSADQVKQAMQQAQAADDADGVEVSWWFGEEDGLEAKSSEGEADIVLSDTDMWTPFAKLATLSIYGNGIYVGRVLSYKAADYQGVVGCTLGAYNNNGTLQDGLNGTLAEVRVWATARTQNQLQEAMYHPLLGSEQHLRAYWPLDGNLSDLSGGGNNGVALGTATYTPSTAPVANEGPLVRNVYNGPLTDFQEPITGRATVLDYGDTELTADGESVANLRRCYFFNNPTLLASTKYSVGELDLVYIGMAQTNPTLIGFIEGAPPVPSENLTRPLYKSFLGYNGYADVATVTLTQAESDSLTFSSSNYKTTFAIDWDVKAGLLGNIDVDIAANVGLFFISKDEFTQKWKAGVHTKGSAQWAKQTDTKYISSWTRTEINAMGLRGTWEPEGKSAEDYLNPQVGRRYQPSNLGYALVESLTADVYAMCLRGSGVAVGKIVVPDLAIPADRNILMFQINPYYTKNGTLDGKVGWVNDVNYTTADQQRGSYFKPEEAYRLKAKSERAEQNLLTFFDSFREERSGRDDDTSLDGPAAQQVYNFGDGVARKSIVNTYVWDAYGGFYRSEEQYSATYERVYNGFYNLNWSDGPYSEGEFVPGNIGLFYGVDVLMGEQIKVQVGRGRAQGRQLGLTVTAPGEPFLPSYLPSGDYTTEPAPGKVTTYRFMSFYLPPSTDNADVFRKSVVDRTWLDASDDPNAIALRGARIEGNSVWRVMHRVTYVARVPPEIDGAPVQSSAPDEQWAILVEDNLLLVQLVAAALGSNPATPVNLGAAVAAVLAPTNGDKPVLAQYVPWWQGFIASTQGLKPNKDAQAVLNQILSNTTAYLVAGYGNGVLPLPAPADA